MEHYQAIFFITVIAFLLNLPFGMLRIKYRKFSIQWFICIHAPIPIVAILRITTKTSWKYIPLFLIASILGQVVGAKLKALKT
ncbi:hypothetical protein FHQ18_09020 [Deferribacter autotrophicus]|uniref:Uncharacterized protein n=1 Tax=Deferribacter autotrophicus TaxID=500465 RepID=A0A5A8F5D1_9BACT|nr:hypothetical protein [Deferribacter autotrophicus]KAA0257872.1 hypothetical protein FHQ18_09020 [Deferribacter autotrophicus]